MEIEEIAKVVVFGMIGMSVWLIIIFTVEHYKKK